MNKVFQGQKLLCVEGNSDVSTGEIYTVAENQTIRENDDLILIVEAGKRIGATSGGCCAFRFKPAPIKPGDTVKVIDAEDSAGLLHNGNVHVVSSIKFDRLQLQGVYAGSGWWPQRFIRISNQTQPNPTKSMCHSLRHPNGRFAPVASVTSTPTKLRPGSLYRVVGGPVARYVGSVKKFAVLTVHGKPVTVNPDRVKLADKADVQAYLADSAAA